MKNIYFICTLLSLIFAFQLHGQQVPYSTYQILRGGNYLPGNFPEGNVNQVHFNVQQRSMSIAGLSSGSQFLQFDHKPVGKKKSFSWGFILTNDREHTEQRFALTPQISAKILDKGGSTFSLGISAGILNWRSNYTDRRMFDEGDPELLGVAAQLLEVDAGLGGHYRYQKEALRVDASLALTQLAGNVLDDDPRLIPILPHVTMNLRSLYQVSPAFSIGPNVFYRNIFGTDTIRQGGGVVDLGIQAELPEKNLWVAGTYRVDNSAFQAGFGFRVAGTDTTPHKDLFGSFVDLNFGFSYPMAGASVFGPTAEVGVKWSFGKKKIPVIKIERYASNFWKSDDAMTEHRVQKIDPNGPEDLRAQAEVSQRAVYMTYTFPDFSRRYIGDAPVTRNDTLLYRIGMEWPGVDGLMENIPAYTIKEALWPDTTHVVDLENLEKLRKLAWIELSANLRGDEERVHFSSDVIYEGELGTNNVHNDTLFLDVVFNDQDTTLAIRLEAFTSQLELAALKLHAMRKKLEYELMAQYGDEFVVVWEGQEQDEESGDYRTPMMIRKPRIIPNNPQMQFFQENKVELKFFRDRKYVKGVENLKEERSVLPSEEEKLGVTSEDSDD